MPKAKNVEKKIWDIEEFEVDMTKDGKNIRGDKKLTNQYEFEKKAKGSQTVAKWKEKRFNKVYEGYGVDVKLANGDVAKGNMTLTKVRDSYIDDEDD
jgi:hypothetical protein